MDADALINRSTLYPYYAAHQPLRVRCAVRAAMRGGNASTVHHRLGIPAYGVVRPSFLRFCPDCMLEQLRREGEAHWLRSHQAPGVLVCPVHAVMLRDSTVRPSTASRYVPAGRSVCPDHALGPDRVGAAAMAVLVALASRTEGLLSDAGEPRDPSDWRGIYRKSLDSIGLMRSRHKVDQVRLSGALSDFYGHVLHLLPRACGRLGPGGWPERIVRSHRRAFHPLLHVMLQTFMDGSGTVVSPFGQAPWPCLNPLAGHFGQRVVDALDRHHNRDTLVGVFSCRCGYVYTRCLRADGRLDEPRMRAVGPLFGPALRRLLVPGCTLRGVARALGVDPKTLMREAGSLEIPVGWGTSPSGRPRPLPRVKRRRSETTTRMAYLSTGEPRRDWTVLDRQLADRLEREARAILAAVPPVRVTLAELERRLGVRGWLAKRKAKLPLSRAAATRSVETVDDVKRRRVRHVIVPSVSADAASPWRVMRMAGLSGPDLPMIREDIARHVPGAPDPLAIG